MKTICGLVEMTWIALLTTIYLVAVMVLGFGIFVIQVLTPNQEQYKLYITEIRNKPMPNHTTVKLVVEGPSELVGKFIEENRGDDSPLSFETQHPTPSEAMDDKTQRDSSGEFKMPDWYTWRLENWGTKWDCYDHTEWEGGEIKFFTAWSPPTNFFLYITTW